MDKLTMAQDYIISEVRRVGICSIDEDKIMDAWKVADAMQAESDKRKPGGLPDALKEEWQPDWSKAPEWANWWAMDLDLDQAHWYEVEPSIDAITWRRRTRICKCAPSFDYQGNWKDSLRKRPQ